MSALVERIGRNPVIWAIAAVIAALILTSVFVVVPETRQAVLVRLGKPEEVWNPYKADQPLGRTGAGVFWRIPFVDQLVWVDKRVLDFDMERQSVLSTDQQRIEVDAFARYRIVNPLRMYLSAGSEDQVARALQPILGSSLRNELGKVPFAALLSPERGDIMDNIQARLNRVARQYGAEIVDVRIKRADLPDGSPLESAFQRMRTAREQEALTIRAEGRRQAQEITGQADADAARVYAEAFGKDADFYDFYRAMQSYRHTFGTDGQGASGTSQVILSPNNDYLREFMGRR